jgi:hypothetical protein
MTFKSLYTIEGLSAKARGMGRSGISISLDGEVAHAILTHKERRNDKSPLIQMMHEEVGNKSGRIEFIEDSWLLRYIQLEPMSCSCFGIDGMYLDNAKNKRDVVWTPHNIDSPTQALKLVSIWLYWFNVMSALGDSPNYLIRGPIA